MGTIFKNPAKVLVMPPSVRRQAGIKAGDRLEFKASRGVITILTKSKRPGEEYTPEQRRVIDREISKRIELMDLFGALTKRLRI